MIMSKAEGRYLPWEAVGNSSKKNTTPSRKNLGKPASAKTLILGVGNVLMGDEGIGVLALKHLEAAGLGTRAELVDGGTGGFHLLGYFVDYERLILIDAASDGKPPGTVSHIKPRFAADFPQSLVAHDIGLKDLIESAVLLGALPKVDLITVSIGEIRPMTLEPSADVAAAIPAIQAAVEACLN